MNGKLYFDLAEVVRIAEATVAGTNHRDSFSDQADGVKTGPALVWAKDQGTYLLSNANPRPDGDVIYARASRHDGLLLSQDATSAPGDWDEVWQTTREICGGDDFAEYLALDDLLSWLQASLRAGQTHLVLEVDDEAMQVGTEKAS